jgi:eukaryotic-like serine/threonine-protein kinase
LEKQAQDLLEQVRNLARRDSLTNLYNHRYFFEIAEIEFTRIKRYQHSLAAIMIDLDHFKQVNDTYGHLVGDQVLQMVSERMQSNLRAVDILGRVGGEEFIALLPETSADEAVVIAERLCGSIGQHLISIGKENIHVTASLGVSVYSDTCTKLNGLIERADQALYFAKRNGRNRVEVWNEVLPTH